VEAVTVGSQRRKVRLLLAARRVDAANGRSSSIELSLQAPDATLAADEPTRVFDGFRLLTGRSGLGLGPHLARRFVELHMGEVNLVPGQGVRFDVSLPVLPDTRTTGQVATVTTALGGRP
jgi:K+-sensing histidine kinase KdpD